MDRKTLKQYRALKRELVLIDQGIEELQRRAERIPTVRGKVTGSSHDWPYIETHYPVEMDEPKEADEIRRRLRIKENRKVTVSRMVVEIEEFIAGIPDSADRQIFEMCFLQGKRQQEVARQAAVRQTAVRRTVETRTAVHQTAQIERIRRARNPARQTAPEKTGATGSTWWKKAIHLPS